MAQNVSPPAGEHSRPRAALEVDMLTGRKTVVAGFVVASGLLFAVQVHAQAAAQAPQAAPAPRAQAAPAPAGDRAGARGAAGLNLTDAQREQIRALRQTQRTEAQALRQRFRADYMKLLTPDQQARAKEARARAQQRARRAARMEQRMQMRRNQIMRDNQLMRRNQMMRQWRWWI